MRGTKIAPCGENEAFSLRCHFACAGSGGTTLLTVRDGHRLVQHIRRHRPYRPLRRQLQAPPEASAPGHSGPAPPCRLRPPAPPRSPARPALPLRPRVARQFSSRVARQFSSSGPSPDASFNIFPHVFPCGPPAGPYSCNENFTSSTRTFFFLHYQSAYMLVTACLFSV